MEPPRAGTGGHRLDRRGVGAGAVLLPLVLTLLWVPVRRQLPNVDVALALVLAVTASGATGRRSVMVLGAVGAAAGFAFFDTQPYEHWVISRQPDLETLLVLVVVSLVAGELAVRVARARAGTAPSADDMARIRDIAALVASGAELVSILGTVSEELTRLLAAAGCTYEAGDSPPGALVIGRDGVHHRTATAAPLPPGGPSVIEVPVTGMNQVLGRFLVVDPAPGALQPQRLLVALTLADQVGAALIAQAPESASPSTTEPAPVLRPALRVVK